MANWSSIKWLLWISLYLTSVVFLPWGLTRAWAHQHGKELDVGPKQLFRRGELGIVSLILAMSVIWNLLESQFLPHTRALGSVILALAGIMAASVWVETHCRQSSGTDWHPERAWKDSKHLAFLVFSMAAVMEILLDRFAKVVAQ
jgi:hypothetical protein